MILPDYKNTDIIRSPFDEGLSVNTRETFKKVHIRIRSDLNCLGLKVLINSDPRYTTPIMITEYVIHFQPYLVKDIYLLD